MVWRGYGIAPGVDFFEVKIKIILDFGLLLQERDNPTETMREYLESAMAIEFIRVEDEDTTVVIGFD